MPGINQPMNPAGTARSVCVPRAVVGPVQCVKSASQQRCMAVVPTWSVDAIGANTAIVLHAANADGTPGAALTAVTDYAVDTGGWPIACPCAQAAFTGDQALELAVSALGMPA